MNTLGVIATALLATLVLWQEYVLPVLPWIVLFVSAATALAMALDEVKARQFEILEQVLRARREHLLEEKLARPTAEQSRTRGLLEDELAALAVIKARAEDVARVCEGVKLGVGSSTFVVREMVEIMKTAQRIQEKLNQMIKEE